LFLQELKAVVVVEHIDKRDDLLLKNVKHITKIETFLIEKGINDFSISKERKWPLRLSRLQGDS